MSQIKVEAHVTKSHFTHEPRDATMKFVGAQMKVSKGRPNAPPKTSSVVTDRQVQCEGICDRALNQMLISMKFYSCRSSPMIKQNKSTVVSVWSAMGPPVLCQAYLQEVVLKIVQVTVEHDPFDAMQESMQTLHPSCIHILRWSLKRSVKRTWTSSAFPTNESA